MLSIYIILPCNLTKVTSHNFHATDDQTAVIVMAIQQNTVTCFHDANDLLTIYGYLGKPLSHAFCNTDDPTAICGRFQIL